METFTYRITKNTGIDPVKAGDLVKEILEYSSSVRIFKGERSANGRNIFNIIGLSASKGDTIECVVEGEEERSEAERLKEYFSLNL